MINFETECEMDYQGFRSKVILKWGIEFDVKPFGLKGIDVFIPEQDINVILEYPILNPNTNTIHTIIKAFVLHIKDPNIQRHKDNCHIVPDFIEVDDQNVITVHFL